MEGLLGDQRYRVVLLDALKEEDFLTPLTRRRFRT